MSTTWGLVATILAPAEEILHFAAYHLERGAHRVIIYLDAENAQAHAALKAHPKCRVFTCTDAWWEKRGGRPQKHQVRQAENATQAYRRRADVDWLIHMDVDEFLVADQNIAARLGALPADTRVARVRPMEALAGTLTAFKGFVPAEAGRARIIRELYPTYGDHVKGGFLSHLAGKVFIRTGLPDVSLRIHNGFQNGAEIKGLDLDQDDIALAHCHAKTWEQWLGAYRFRLSRGSYREGLAPNKPREDGGVSLNELFSMIEKTDGEAGLRAFFEEVCADSPALRARLARHGLLREAHLTLKQPLSSHFPGLTL
ncbi:MAG: glycosyltransferase family 2 protein [Pseudomonadota bacterium]